MQAVIAIPELRVLREYGDPEKMLMQKVAGVPLLVRVIATSMRAGVNELILFWPAGLDRAIWAECAGSVELRGLKTWMVPSFPFDPHKKSSWTAFAALLKDEFLWIPWNFITAAGVLAAVEPSPALPLSWDTPIRLTSEVLFQCAHAGVTSARPVEGFSIQFPADIPRAERYLVSKSGKATDGIYSRFNRRLCRPAVRILARTSVTPNAVTLVGLGVAVASTLLYARGSYLNYVAGALLFFLSGLIDDMDGMLARLKFRESAFGTWFEGFVDNATYLLLFSGITAGLYRQRGAGELAWGIALVAGSALSAFVVAMQRKALTAPSRPHEYSARMNELMEEDSSLISRIVRQIHIFIRKGVAVHYILIFTVAGILPLFLRMASIAANLTWTLALYFSWRFTRSRRAGAVEALESVV